MSNKVKGMIALITAHLIWGVQSLYWNTMSGISTTIMLSNRIVWAEVCLLFIVIATRRMDTVVAIFKNRRNLMLMFMSAVFIFLNWYINIYASISGKIVEMSLGQYASPIVTILVAVIFFREKLSKPQLVSLIFVCIALGIMAVQIKKMPLIAIFVVLSFVLYTAVRKVAALDPIASLCVEMAVMFIPALVYTVYTMGDVISVVSAGGIYKLFMLIGTGLYTCVPLLLYSYAINNLELTTIGFIKYFSPTIGLLLGIFVFKEAFCTLYLLAFAIIWIAIVIVMISEINKISKQNQKFDNAVLEAVEKSQESTGQ